MDFVWLPNYRILSNPNLKSNSCHFPMFFIFCIIFGISSRIIFWIIFESDFVFNKFEKEEKGICLTILLQKWGKIQIGDEKFLNCWGQRGAKECMAQDWLEDQVDPWFCWRRMVFFLSTSQRIVASSFAITWKRSLGKRKVGGAEKKKMVCWSICLICTFHGFSGRLMWMTIAQSVSFGIHITGS